MTVGKTTTVAIIYEIYLGNKFRPLKKIKKEIEALVSIFFIKYVVAE